jgi:hypothetical protein
MERYRTVAAKADAFGAFVLADTQATEHGGGRRSAGLA